MCLLLKPNAANVPSIIDPIVATIGSIILGTLAALGLSSRHMPYKGIIMATLISPMIVPLIISGVAIFFFSWQKLV